MEEPVIEVPDENNEDYDSADDYERGENNENYDWDDYNEEDDAGDEPGEFSDEEDFNLEDLQSRLDDLRGYRSGEQSDVLNLPDVSSIPPGAQPEFLMTVMVVDKYYEDHEIENPQM